jgi:hypothetical protein
MTMLTFDRILIILIDSHGNENKHEKKGVYNES